jgi:hypothetical protein
MYPASLEGEIVASTGLGPVPISTGVVYCVVTRSKDMKPEGPRAMDVLALLTNERGMKIRARFGEFSTRVEHTGGLPSLIRQWLGVDCDFDIGPAKNDDRPWANPGAVTLLAATSVRRGAPSSSKD